MLKPKLFIAVLIGLFGIQSVGDAASISTRVRILESKVYKNAKEIKRQSKSNAEHSVELKRGLKEVAEIKEQFEAFMKQQKSEEKAKQKKKQLADKRYAYP